MHLRQQCPSKHRLASAATRRPSSAGSLDLHHHGICVVVCWVLLERTKYGRYLYAMGGNKTAAKLSGINVKKMRFMARYVRRHLHRHRRYRGLLP